MRTPKYLLIALLGLIVMPAFSGCWLVAAGAGAEAGYVAAQPDRTASETLTDQKITAAVKAKLLADSDVPGLDINVDTFKGIVTLTGVLKDAAQREKAINLASSVDDVKEVHSKLYIG